MKPFCFYALLVWILAVGIVSAQEKTGQQVYDGISMDFQEADLKDVLKIFSQQSGLNFVANENISNKKVTVYLEKVSIEDALYNIMRTHQLTYEKLEGSDIFVVSTPPPPPALTVPTLTKVYVLKYAQVGTAASEEDSGEDNIGDVIQSLLSEHGNLVAEGRTNSLIITDISEKFPLIEQIIAELDVPVPQVAIEAEVLETVTTTLERIGIEYGGSLGQMGKATSAKRGTNFPFPERLSATSKPTFTVGTLDASTFTLALELLTKDSNTRFLSRPKVITLNNQTAEIKISAETAVASISTITASEGTSQTTTEPERMETGIILKVTPQINDQDRVVTMLVEPEVSRAEDSKFFSGSFADPIKRTVKTTVMLNDNETLVIGGLIERQTSNSDRKFPLLGDLPLAGPFFTKKISDTTDRELVVFVTPHIIAPGESRSALPLLSDHTEHQKKEKIREDLEAIELIKSLRE